MDIPVYLTLLLLQSNMVYCILRKLTNVDFSSTGRTSGVAVSDLDNDGTFEVLVSVLDGPNMILKYDTSTKKYYDVSKLDQKYNVIRDEKGKTISVCACDMDRDGIEDVYLHNHNDVYPTSSNMSVVPDKLFTIQEGRYVDMFSFRKTARSLAPRYGGHSVACIDRNGSGTYDVIVTTYTKDGKGTYKVFTTKSNTKSHNTSVNQLTEISKKLGLNMTKDGRAVLVGPLFPNKYTSDIFITNDNSYYIGSSVTRHDGQNVLFRNKGHDTFRDVAGNLGVADRNNNGRGAAMGDFNADGNLDILFVNWMGPAHIYQHQLTNTTSIFQKVDRSASRFSRSSATNILLTGDFNNDGQTDVLKAAADGDELFPNYNEIFTSVVNRNITDITLDKTVLDNDDTFKNLQVRGIAVADLDGDGVLELFISHDVYHEETLSIFENRENVFNWIRVVPLTKTDSFARGSIVTLTLGTYEERQLVIGGDCSYMCQSEPVAHFGLGNDVAKEVKIIWSDGHKIRKLLHENDNKQTLIITYSGSVRYMGVTTALEVDVSLACVSKSYLSLYVFVLLFYELANVNFLQFNVIGH